MPPWTGSPRTGLDRVMQFLPPEARDQMPAGQAVRDLYAAASSETPLREAPSVATLFADLYADALQHERVSAAVSYEGSRLAAFAYGHPWRWDEQQDPWSIELKHRLGHAAELVDGSHALLLLARDPTAQGRGIGRSVLQTWLRGIGDGCVWLQTTDVESPARRLYEAAGFEPIGYGPDAPNGKPGLVLFRGGDTSQIER